MTVSGYVDGPDVEWEWFILTGNHETLPAPTYSPSAKRAEEQDRKFFRRFARAHRATTFEDWLIVVRHLVCVEREQLSGGSSQEPAVQHYRASAVRMGAAELYDRAAALARETEL